MEISRSEKKRQMQQLEQLASALVALPRQLQEQLPCPEELIQGLRSAAVMKGGARKRHIKYLTKLLHAAGPHDELYRFIGRHRGMALVAQRAQRQLEKYRNALIEEALDRAGEEEADWGELWESRIVQALKPELPQVDDKALLRLAYRFAQTRNPRYSREIFRTLKAALEQQQRLQQSAEASNH